MPDDVRIVKLSVTNNTDFLLDGLKVWYLDPLEQDENPDTVELPGQIAGSAYANGVYNNWRSIHSASGNSGGVLSYEITGTNQFLVIFWNVPLVQGRKKTVFLSTIMGVDELPPDMQGKDLFDSLSNNGIEASAGQIGGFAVSQDIQDPSPGMLFVNDSWNVLIPLKGGRTHMVRNLQTQTPFGLLTLPGWMPTPCNEGDVSFHLRLTPHVLPGVPKFLEHPG